MYEKNTKLYDKITHTKSHKNVWQKHAYKCMTKTRIQMYDKNTYKCMIKSRTQNRIKLYDKNTHTNVWQKHAYKCMEKKPHILERWAANYSAQGAWRYSAFPKGTLAVTRRLTANPPDVSPPILFLSGEWGLNCQPSGYWTTTLTTASWPTQIQT